MRWQERASFYAASALLIVLCGLPLGNLLEHAVLVDWRALLGERALWMLFFRSTLIALSVASFSVLIGVPLGVLLGRFNVHARVACLIVHAFPLFLPPFLLALGSFHLFGAGGFFTSQVGAAGLFSTGGAVTLLTLAFTPIVTALTALALQGVDPALEEAARVVAHPASVAARILVPIAAPSIALAALIVFTLAFSELGVPMFLRVPTYPAVIFSRLGGAQYVPGEAFVLALPLLIVSVGVVLVERWIVGKRPFAILGVRRSTAPMDLGEPRLAASLFAWTVAALGLLPMVALLARAWHGRSFSACRTAFFPPPVPGSS
jgi:ABC-type Fe3+ transport system permease subunit